MHRFLAAFSVILGIVLLLFALLVVRVATLGEILDVDPPGSDLRLYGTIYDDQARYKLQQTLLRRPEVLVLGSSTAMQFRSSMFKCSTPGCFYNAGGAKPSMSTGIAFFRRVAAASPPRLLVLVLDYWDFDPAYEPGKHAPISLSLDPREQLDYAIVVGRTVGQLAVQDADVRSALVGGIPMRPDLRGLRALVKGSGFRTDGSYDEGSTSYADYAARAAPERSSLEVSRIDTGGLRFEPYARADEASLAELDLLLRTAAEAGTLVVAMFPPVSDEIAAALARNDRILRGFNATRQAVAAVLTSRRVPFSMSTMSETGCAPEETLDGVHPTEVCDARALLTITDGRDGGSALEPFVDVAKLRDLVARRASPLFLERPE